MKRALLAASLLLGTACSRSPEPSVSYRAPASRFSADLPRGWRVNEEVDDSRLAAFYGPPDGKTPYTQVIAVYFRPASGRWKSAREYLPAESAGGDATDPVETRVGGLPALELAVSRTAPDPHRGTVRTRTRAVLAQAKDGFYVLELTYPDGAAPSPAFDAFLASFKPQAAK
jgi:hypothetical protein